MRRTPEPELMDDVEQARAYAETDFSESNGLFVDLVDRYFSGQPPDIRVLDLGCGPADIPIRLVRKHPQWTVHAVDGSSAMLALARKVVERESLTSRIRLICDRLPDLSVTAKYSMIISNSLLHHLSDPLDLWRCVRRFGDAGSGVLVMDLCRPSIESDVELLVEQYAADALEILVRDFRASLRAAYTADEVSNECIAPSC